MGAATRRLPKQSASARRLLLSLFGLSGFLLIETNQMSQINLSCSSSLSRATILRRPVLH